MTGEPDGGDRRPSASQYPGAPMWVRVFVAVLIALVVLFLATTLLGAHQPMQHGG
jgi:hypothetical protein